jgi:hypothetical protein
MPVDRSSTNRLRSYPLGAKILLDSCLQHPRITWGRSCGNPAAPLPTKGTFAVGDILVRCPYKGTPVRTGLRTEWVLLHSLPRVGVPLHCPACGEMHKWFPQDAWISVGVQPCAADATDQYRTAEVKV